MPRQLILAAGATPVRLTGAWKGEVSQESVDFLGAADAVAVRVLDAVLSGTHDGLSGLVVCNDSSAHLRIFYVLRVLAERNRISFPVHLLDTPRGSGVHRNRFVARQYERMADFAASRTMTPVENAGLTEAAAREALLGQALKEVRQRRRARTLAGSVALRCYLAAAQRNPEEAVAEIEAALNSPPRPETSSSAPPLGLQSAVPVFMTGSSHPDPMVYETLEEAGYLVVGEDHDTGDDSWIGDPVGAGERALPQHVSTPHTPQHVSTPHTGPRDLQSERLCPRQWGSGSPMQERGGGSGDIYQLLAKRHAQRPPTAARSLSSERADHLLKVVEQSGALGVMAVVRDLDDGPAWDVPEQRKALARTGRSLAAVVQIPADGIGEATAAVINQVQFQEAPT